MGKQKIYFVYKITNNINRKTYIGCHETYNLYDGYMGSGTLIKRAIKKYGVNNFSREILKMYPNRHTMYNNERQIIASLRPEYNLCLGGRGGFHYINSRGLNLYPNKRAEASEKMAKTLSKRHEIVVDRYNNNPNLCLRCKSAMPYQKRHNKYCNKSCSAFATTRGRIVSQETREKIARKLSKPKMKCGSCLNKLRSNNRTGFCYRHKPNRVTGVKFDIDDARKKIKSMSYREVAKIYGVNHVTLFKALK